MSEEVEVRESKTFAQVRKVRKWERKNQGCATQTQKLNSQSLWGKKKKETIQILHWFKTRQLKHKQHQHAEDHNGISGHRAIS